MSSWNSSSLVLGAFVPISIVVLGVFLYFHDQFGDVYKNIKRMIDDKKDPLPSPFIKKQIDEQLKDGYITKEQADELIQMLNNRTIN